MLVVAGLLVLLGAAVPKPAAAAAPTGGPALGREAARAALRARAKARIGNAKASASSAGPVQAAGASDAVSFIDPMDVTDPRGDILQVGVGSGPGRSLLFTMQLEQYADR